MASLATSFCRAPSHLHHHEAIPDDPERQGSIPDIPANNMVVVMEENVSIGLQGQAREASNCIFKTRGGFKNTGPSSAQAFLYYLIMATSSIIVLFVALRVLLITYGTLPAGAVPTYTSNTQGSNFWMSSIKRQGTAAFNPNPSSYRVFRNVKEFGAKGDGVTDDTVAINTAISQGGRCGRGCDSSTVSPALVYFPAGTYLVSAPIIQYYYTQFVGDAISIPTIKAAASFQGIAVIDADPYDETGHNWYTNQNNFFRQVRNFVIDLTAMPATVGTGIHWQVAQATSLQNIRFEMVKGTESKQQGIFMDNGSGGFLTDLTFNGGRYGAFFGNQQFTTRNLVFNNVQTAIFMNWNWAWTFKSLSINNCGVGIDMANGGSNQQAVGSVLVLDSKISGTPIGISTAFNGGSQPNTGGTLIIDNVDFTGSVTAVADPSGRSILAGNTRIASWGQGRQYISGAGGSRFQGPLTPPSKPASLLNAGGLIYERSRPQYQDVADSRFISVKSHGARGDGVTDDTAAIQTAINTAQVDEIVYFDSGAYVVSQTVKIPKNIRITGEIWPLILASGPAFQDENNPTPVFQIGVSGDEGAVEISDLIFQTVGPQPGAVLVEWNVRDPQGQQGASGMWDVHFRIGGSAGTKLQSAECAKNPSVIAPAAPGCRAAFLLLHVTQQASIYLENNWFWVADHELDLADHSQINIFNGRGVLIESAQGPVWMYGTSSEHSQLYNYQIVNSENVFMGLIQTETPYYQSNPNALTPFTPNPVWHDPTFASCQNQVSCPKSWGLRIVDSKSVFVYGAGLYSFFENYGQDCLNTESCQDNMLSIEGSSSSLHLYGLSTKASTSMVTVNGNPVVQQIDNRDGFCSTVALFEQ
ncbi:hypothetical protein FGG08_000095 [Glutinoglossum americanum]|uniref:Rhamnogalacturonase A/B/Epimerase-like pectate lyase domain-containing protein n=1 Tax=Glutinoglossum americanum TaxID=1670608 RepID=A0A9P8I9Y2_9PEZI|nr:hypothetical protein FGG08_000095 [Glutinoglossum americanum]